jgi:hypothetical protein
VKSFADSFSDLLKVIETRRNQEIENIQGRVARVKAS